MGETVITSQSDYHLADIVILGCPQDEGVRRNNGREGAAKAPDAIRAQFFKLTTFNIKRRVFDLGNINVGNTLEETHDIQIAVVKQVLQDGKRLIILGGGNDISYADGRAMSEVYGPSSPSLAPTIKNLAQAERRLGRYDAAERHVRDALALAERLGAEHPLTLDVRREHAILLTKLGRPDEAEWQFGGVLHAAHHDVALDV